MQERNILRMQNVDEDLVEHSEDANADEDENADDENEGVQKSDDCKRTVLAMEKIRPVLES